MTQENFESQFLDYLEERLSPQEMEQLRLELESNAELRASFEAYSKIVEAEHAIAKEAHTLHPNFSVKVMDKLDSPAEQGFLERLSMFLSENRRLVYSSVATCATLVVVLSITNRPLPLEVETDMIRERQRAEERAVVAAPEKSSAVAGGVSAPVIAKEAKPGSEARMDSRREAKDELGAISSSLDDLKKADKAKAFQVQPVVPQERAGAAAGVAGTMSDAESFGVEGQAAPAPQQEFGRKQIPAAQRGPGNTFSMDMSALGKNSRRKVLKMDSATGAVSEGTAYENSPMKVLKSEGMMGVKAAAPPYLDSLASTYQEPSNESYISVSENKRTLVQEEPVSTFSIDVDTASYANVRRMISAGQLPPADAVRIEEFVNYFDYAYPVQYEKPFTLSYEIAPSPLEKDKFLLKLGVKARDAQPNQKGWNLVLLVDVSGSMTDSNKLPLLKRSLPVLVEHMRPQDKIAIVTYAGNAGVALESTNGTEKFRIQSAIDNLSSGGSTNGAGGITAAYEIAQRNMIEGGVNRVILMTDGDFNVGITSHDDLIRMIEQKRRSGITLTTIGVGTGNLKDGMMEQLADKGNGNYFYLDSFKEARKVLQTDLVGNMEVVAKDVKLQIEFNPQQVAEYRLVGYDNRRLQKQDFNNDAIDAGEIGTGHTVTALYEVVLTNTEAAKRLQEDLRYQKAAEQKKVEVPEDKRSELAFLKIRYKKPTEERSNLLEYPIAAADVRKDAAQTTDDFRFAAAVTYFGNLLRKSQFAGNYSFADIATLAQGAKGADQKGYRQEFIEMVKDAKALSPGSAMPITGRANE